MLRQLQSGQHGKFTYEKIADAINEAYQQPISLTTSAVAGKIYRIRRQAT